jgi:hypothetical protein
MSLRTLNAKAAGFDRIARNGVSAVLMLVLLLVTLLCLFWGGGVMMSQCIYWLQHGEWVALPVEAMFTPSSMIPPEKHHPLKAVAVFRGADIDGFIQNFRMKGAAKILQWVVNEVPVVVGVAVVGFGSFWACLRVGNMWESKPVDDQIRH